MARSTTLQQHLGAKIATENVTIENHQFPNIYWKPKMNKNSLKLDS